MTPKTIAPAERYSTYDNGEYPRFSYIFDSHADPQVLAREGRVWFGSRADYAQAERDCHDYVRSISVGKRVWIVQQWRSDASIALRHMVEGGKVTRLHTVIPVKYWTENQILAQPTDLRDQLRSVLSRLNPKETPMNPPPPTPTPPTFDPTVMAEQLLEWAAILDEGNNKTSVPGVIAAMREVAADLSPTCVFDRVVTFTRHWYDDWEQVVPRFTVGIGPMEAWTDQVRDEIVDALPAGAELVWEQVSIEGEGGAERLTARAHLHFEYPVSEYPDLTDAEMLQQLLYDEGGVCGDFQLVEGGEG